MLFSFTKKKPQDVLEKFRKETYVEDDLINILEAIESESIPLKIIMFNNHTYIKGQICDLISDMVYDSILHNGSVEQETLERFSERGFEIHIIDVDSMDLQLGFIQTSKGLIQFV